MLKGAATLACACFCLAQTPAAPDRWTVYRVPPHETDPGIQRFDAAHLVLFDPAAPEANLLVFLAGSGASPSSVTGFLRTAVEQGYRAISLSYDDLPAVVAVCPRDPDPQCSARVREKRIFGHDVTHVIDDRPAESIVNRLARLLSALDRAHPDEHWRAYLDGDQPAWSRIALAGHSQGAGMAAFMAQRLTVARVILLSSPWDFYGRERTLAPWIYQRNGSTPADAWYGAYHKHENTSAMIAAAFEALRIPRDHIRVLTRPPARAVGPNPYHLSVVVDGVTPRGDDGQPLYAEDWRFVIGRTPLIDRKPERTASRH